MSLSNTAHSWGKELGKAQHVGAGITPMDRWEGRKARPQRKHEERMRKMAGKMKKENYPAKFTSAQEEETK